MTIEVRQLVIKSTVQSPFEAQLRQTAEFARVEELKQDILVECRRLIADAMAEARER